jgi:hypothetical protein
MRRGPVRAGAYDPETHRVVTHLQQQGSERLGEVSLPPPLERLGHDPPESLIRARGRPGQQVDLPRVLSASQAGQDRSGRHEGRPRQRGLETEQVGGEHPVGHGDLRAVLEALGDRRIGAVLVLPRHDLNQIPRWRGGGPRTFEIGHDQDRVPGGGDDQNGQSLQLQGVVPEQVDQVG